MLRLTVLHVVSCNEHGILLPLICQTVLIKVLYLEIFHHLPRFVCAWLYYGVVLLTTSFLQYDPHCGTYVDKILMLFSGHSQFSMLHTYNTELVVLS